jgi:multiple sugar transport system substrate-binding protein
MLAKKWYILATVVMAFSLLAACEPAMIEVEEVVVTEVPVEVEVTVEVPIEVEVTQVAGPVEVRLVGWRSTDPVEDDLQRYLLDECGVTYELETDYWEYWDKLLPILVSGEEIDILYMDTTYLPLYAQQGLLAPLDNAPGIEWDEFFYSLIKAFTFEGTIYALPKDLNTLALFYNRELFAAAGLEEPTNDWTWDDLREAALTITESTGVPGFAVSPSPFPFSVFVFQNGGLIMTEDFSDTWIDSPEAVEAGFFYTDARREGWAILPRDVGIDREDEAFGQYAVAMVLAGRYMISYLSDQFQDLDYGAVHPPAGPAGEGNMVSATAYAVSANSSAPQAALDAIACLTSEESQSLILESGVALPSRQSLAGHPYLEDNPAANAVFTGAEFAFPIGWGPRHEEVYHSIRIALELVYDEELSVDESLIWAAERIRSLIAE